MEIVSIELSCLSYIATGPTQSQSSSHWIVHWLYIEQGLTIDSDEFQLPTIYYHMPFWNGWSKHTNQHLPNEPGIVFRHGTTLLSFNVILFKSSPCPTLICMHALIFGCHCYCVCHFLILCSFGWIHVCMYIVNWISESWLNFHSNHTLIFFVSISSCV